MYSRRKSDWYRMILGQQEKYTVKLMINLQLHFYKSNLKTLMDISHSQQHWLESEW